MCAVCLAVGTTAQNLLTPCTYAGVSLLALLIALIFSTSAALGKTEALSERDREDPVL